MRAAVVLALCAFALAVLSSAPGITGLDALAWVVALAALVCALMADTAALERDR